MVLLQSTGASLPGGSDGEESACNAGDALVGKILWGREWQPTSVLLPGESHGQRSLVGNSPWGRKESDMTKQLTLSLFFHFFSQSTEQNPHWSRELKAENPRKPVCGDKYPGGDLSGQEFSLESFERLLLCFSEMLPACTICQLRCWQRDLPCWAFSSHCDSTAQLRSVWGRG